MPLFPETDKTRLLERLDTEYAFVERTLEAVTPPQFDLPGADDGGPWSIKDVLAHLTRWLTRVPRWVMAAQRGDHAAQAEIEPGYGWERLDALNDDNAAADRALPLDEVLRGFRSAHFALVEFVEALPETDLALALHPDLGVTAYNVIADNSFDHYYEHFLGIRRWLAGQA